QLGHAADEPAHRRRDRQHPHLRPQFLGQRRWPGAAGQGRTDPLQHAACGRRGTLAMTKRALLLSALLSTSALAADADAWIRLPGHAAFTSVLRWPDQAGSV